MSDNLDLVRSLIERLDRSPQQRLTFAEYMAIVLTDLEHGYYATNSEVIGKEGDFFTSPHLGKDFGELLAIQFHQLWQILGCEDRFTLLELGAGQGLLAVQILDYLKANYPEFFQIIDYQIVETSAAMIAKQREKLAEFPVSWIDLADLPDRSIVGCCFSNEFFDALPVHQIIKQDDRLQEVYITKGTGDRYFSERIGELADRRLQLEYWQLNGVDLTSDRYPEGYRTEVNLAALDWLKSIATKLDRGYIITIDYGYSADRYYNPIRSSGTLQAYYQHRHHNDPFINIGYQDLTAHIDFTALDRWGNSLGLETCGFTYQGMFLMSLGLGERLSQVINPSNNLQQTLQRRQCLHQLIDPQGLGKFGVLIQSKNLTSSQQSIALQGLTE
jgi:SAM-dependent MidA family methyltransferase